MIKLHFERSKSSRLPVALRQADVFNVSTDGEGYSITPAVKTIYEHWDDFNSLFWIVVDWKGTYLKVDNIEFHSHSDMSRIFYALQSSHTNWMCYVEMKTSKFFKDGVFKDGIEFDNKEADYLIDLHTIKVNEPDVF